MTYIVKSRLAVCLSLPGVLALGSAIPVAGQKPDTVRARVTAMIGEDAARTPFLLGEVSGLALDDSGRVYVADFQIPRIVVFASDGRQLAIIGRKGEGPGEFTAPTGLVLAQNGALYVRNMEQIVRFLPDPKTGLAMRFDRALHGPGMAPWRSKLPSTIDTSGRFYFPLQVGLRDGLTHYAYRRYSLEGKELDSLPVPLYPTTRSSWASYPISPGTGRMVAGLNVVPFHPSPAWTVTRSGTMLSGPADKYELNETDEHGRVIRTMSRPLPAERIPAPERAESLRALKRRIDSLPVPLSALKGASAEVLSLRLPEFYPWYRTVGMIVETGEVWVQRWTPPALRGSTVLDVFAPNGAYRNTVVLPMDCVAQPTLVLRRHTAACVQIAEDTGAESVVVARLVR